MKQATRKRNIIIAAAILLTVAAVCLFILLHGAAWDYPVRLNEIMCANRTYPNPDGICCDYIELYNTASSAADLSGYRITDGNGNDYVFPEGTSMQPGAYMIIYCDRDKEDNGYAAFGLTAEGGETVQLLSPKNAVLDSVTTTAMEPDTVMARFDDGWKNGEQPTPGIANDAENTSDEKGIVINELLQSNSRIPLEDGSLSDYIELYNAGAEPADLSDWVLTDRLGQDKYRFPRGTELAPGAYLVIACDADAENAAAFSLSADGGETVFLEDGNGNILDRVTTLPAEDNTAYARQSDGSFAFTESATPGFENSEAGMQAWEKSRGFTGSYPVFSEVMADNRTTIADSYGEFSDWIELYNPGNTSITLNGWYLSDDPEEPLKWRFPNITIEAGEYLLIFCSGRDSTDGDIHTSFSLSAGEAVLLTGPTGITVDLQNITEAAADRSLEIDPQSGTATETCYATPGYSNDDAGYEAFMATRNSMAELAIWEVMVSNSSYLPDNGQTYDWVELKNISDHTISLQDYSLTDSMAEPYCFTFSDSTLEPGEFTVVMLSGDASLSGKYSHADFSLNAAGDSLYLLKNGMLCDYVLLTEIPNLESCGRLCGQGGFFYMTPSPLKENENGSRRISLMPEFSLAGGVYENAESLTVSISASGEIYYTLDGSVPTEESSRYTEPLVVTETVVLRAISVEQGKRRSKTATAAYIVNEGNMLPVVSLTADPDDLFGSDGIYKSNWGIKEIEIPANIAYYGDDGTFSLDCGISMHGMTSLLVSEKKSFTVRFRNNYDGALNYDLFGDGEITTYYSIMLRADVEDVVSTYMRDNFMGYMASKYSDSLMGMKYKYVILYLNGEYWGIYSIREHYSTEYYASHLGCSADDCTMIKSFYEVGDSLYDIREYIDDHDTRDPDVYSYLCTVLDMESFADWITLEAFCGNADVNGNMRYFYSESDGLWRCALCDVDLSMMDGRCFTVPFDALQHGGICRALLHNEEFQKLLVERIAYWLNGPLSADNCAAKIDEMTAELEPEIDRDAARWDYSVNNWRGFVQANRTFLVNRKGVMLSDLLRYISLDDEQRSMLGY